MANEQGQNGRGEYQIDEIIYAKGGYSKCVHRRTRGGIGYKERVYLNGWPETNVLEYFFFIGPAKYARVPPPARKMLLFSPIIITIILYYAIIRIYAILHIYFQVSKTEGLTELH